jgi:hypothetical protein
MKIIKRADNGSAASPSGWTGSLVACIAEDETCLEALTLLTYLIANNLLPENCRQAILQCRLVALQKNGDPNDPRPIAIGEVFWKIAAFYCTGLSEEHFHDIFAPIQFGHGEAGGSQTAIHLLQAELQLAGPNSAALLLDQSNAFNTADRHKMIEAVYKDPRLAYLHSIVQFGYGGNPTDLFITEHGKIIVTIKSKTGARQGCPLGTLLFCLFFNPIIKDITTQSSSLPTPSYPTQLTGKIKSIAICDDLNQVAERPMDTITLFDRANAHPSMNVNAKKTTILWPHNTLPPSDLVKACKSRNINLATKTTQTLGCIIGCDEDTQAMHASESVKSVNKLLNIIQLPEIPKQMAFAILRLCCNTQINHMLRCYPPSITTDACLVFDDLISNAYLNIHQQPPLTSPNTSRLQAEANACDIELSIKRGGLGLRKSADIRQQAFFSAAITSLNFLPNINPESLTHLSFFKHIISTRNTLQDYGIPVSDTPPDPANAANRSICIPNDCRKLPAFYSKINRIQRTLSQLLESRRYRNLLSAAKAAKQRRLIARLKGRCGPGTTAWLTCHPSSNPRTFTNLEWLAAMRNRRGLTPSENLVECKCGFSFKAHKANANHFHSCKLFKRKAVFVRHELINQTVIQACNDAGIIASKVSKDTFSNTRKIPDGEAYFPDDLVTTDVTCSHPCAPSHLTLCENPGKLLDNAEKKKIDKYSKWASQNDCAFLPLACNAFGLLAESFITYVKKIAHNATIPFHSSFSQAEWSARVASEIFRDISCAIQKGNARISRQGIIFAKQFGKMSSYHGRIASSQNFAYDVNEKKFIVRFARL